jgi:anti-sigma factor RsiW
MEIEDNALDRQLREATPYIEDEGFTARVLQKLPAAKRRRLSVRAIVLLGSSALASTLAYTLSDGGRALVIGVARLATVPTPWLLAAAFASGMLIMASGLVAAISKPARF